MPYIYDFIFDDLYVFLLMTGYIFLPGNIKHFQFMDYLEYLKLKTKFINNEVDIHTQLYAILPEIYLLTTLLILFILIIFNHKEYVKLIYVPFSKKAVRTLCSIYLITFILLIQNPYNKYANLPLFNGMLSVDYYTTVAKLIILISMSIICFFSYSLFWKKRILAYEFYFLYGMVTFFMLVLLSSWNLFTMLLTLEGLSFSLYVLIAFQSKSKLSLEAVIKYFILGAIASGALLLGISYIYGFIQSLDFQLIQECFFKIGYHSNLNDISFLLLLSFSLILFSFFFKLTIVPFHNWALDVYYGVSMYMMVFLLTVVKFSIVTLFIKVLFKPFIGFSFLWKTLLLIFGLLSLIIGCFGAFTEKNLKRFLIYTSINNIGYILIGLSTNSFIGATSSSFYMSTYLYTMVLFFSFILYTSFTDKNYKRYRLLYITDLKKYTIHNPLWSLFLSLLLLSMAGVPPFIGFFAKYKILTSLISAQMYWVVIVVILVSLISAFYYLKLIKIMFFENILKKRNYEAVWIRFDWASFRNKLRILSLSELSLFLFLTIILVFFIFFYAKWYFFSYRLLLLVSQDFDLNWFVSPNIDYDTWTVID